MINLTMLDAGLLVFARVLGVIFAAPLLSSPQFPTFWRLGLGIWLTVLITPLLSISAPHQTLALLLAAAGQATIGLVLGFIAWIPFYSIQVAGGMIDLQMGTGIAASIAPGLNTPTSLSGGFLLNMSSLLFVSTGGLRLLVASLFLSLKILPVGAVVLRGPVALWVVHLTGSVLSSGMVLALPVLVLLFLLNMVLAMLSRMAPQLNVFSLGLSMQPAVGMIGLVLAVPAMLGAFSLSLSGMTNSVLSLARGLHP